MSHGSLRVQKRDGRTEEYAHDKLYTSLVAAAFATKSEEFRDDSIRDDMLSVFGVMSEDAEMSSNEYVRSTIGDEMQEAIEMVIALIEDTIEERKNKVITTFELSQLVHKALAEAGQGQLLKEYIMRAASRERSIESASALMRSVRDLTFVDSKSSNIKRDNANVDGETAMGTMLQYGSAASKAFALHSLIPKHLAEAHSSGAMHIHDMEFYPLTLTCITADQKIAVRQNGKTSVWSASRLAAYASGEPIDFEVWSNGEFVKVNKVMAKQAVDTGIVSILTKGGAEFKVTPEHFITVYNGSGRLEQEDVIAMELLPGTPLVRDFMKMKSASKRISLYKYFKRKQSVYIYDGDKTFSNALKCDSRWSRVTQQNLTPKRLEGILRGSSRLKVAEYYKSGAPLQACQLRYATRSGTNSIPDTLHLNSKLAAFMGYIVASGSLCAGGLAYSAMSDKIMSDFVRCAESVLWKGCAEVKGLRCKITGDEALLQALFDGPLGVLKQGELNSYEPPQWLSHTSRKFLMSFAKALGTHSVLSRRLDGVRGAVSVLSMLGADVGLRRNCVLSDWEDFDIVDSVTQHKYTGVLYDLETENHHFAVNGFKIHNCCQIDIEKLFENGGFNTGHGNIRTPTSIESYAALTCIAIQSNQNEMHGGQSIPALDYYLEKGVAKTLAAELAEFIRSEYELSGIRTTDEQAEIAKSIKADLFKYIQEHRVLNTDHGRRYVRRVVQKHAPEFDTKLSKMWDTVRRRVEKRTQQAMESMVFNLNCLKYDERIYVFDKCDALLKLISVEWIAENFEQGRFLAISLNNVTGEVEFKAITNAVCTGIRDDIYRLRTKAGQEVALTSNHRLKVWDTCSNVITDSYVKDAVHTLSPREFSLEVNQESGIDLTKYGMVRSNTPYQADVLQYSEDLAMLCGIYVADGSISGCRLQLGVAKKISANGLNDIVFSVFGEVNVCAMHVGNPKKVAGYSYGVSSRVCNAFADMCGKGSINKKIPSWVLTGSVEYRRAFLQGYMMCDGSKGKDAIRCLSINRELISQIRLLALSIGELPHTAAVAIKSGFESTVDEAYYASFNSTASARLKLRNKAGNRELVRYNFSFIRNQFKGGEGKYVGGGRRSGTIFTYELDNLIKSGRAEFAPLSNLFVVDIVEKELLEPAKVYDITVADNESFLTEDGVWVHNSMHSRAGAQIPFSSVNFGTCTTWEGRLVIDKFLDAVEAGLGNGETPIFPISVFKMKKGVNLLSTDPNYDLFKKAIHVTARRMYPNFSNLDVGYNAQFYEEGNFATEVAYMGCLEGSACVTYKYNGEVYSDSFEHVWDRLLSDGVKVYKAGLASYMEPDEMYVYDSRNFGITKVKTLIRNTHVGDWVALRTVQGQTIHCTGDHPWPTADGRKIASELRAGDRLFLTLRGEDLGVPQMRCNDLYALGKEFVAGEVNVSDISILTYAPLEERGNFALGMVAAGAEQGDGCSLIRYSNPDSLHIALTLFASSGFTVETVCDDTLKVDTFLYKEPVEDAYTADDGFRTVVLAEVVTKNIQNMFSYDFETESGWFDVSGLQSYNCRTRVIANVNGPQVVTGRGNLSFTSLNLPQIALSVTSVEQFFEMLDKRIALALEQLMARLEIQSKRKVANMPFLMGQGVWEGSDELGMNDEVRPVLKHGTLSIGFVGLAEALVQLVGAHHGESDEAQKLGLKIVKFMRDFCDKKTKEHSLNVTLLATPAESTAGRFLKIDRNTFGVVEGVTDREYYTNSFHIPVWYKTNVRHKVEVEAPYHAMTNAGHITYVELDGDASKNEMAIEDIVIFMYEKGCGYFSVSHAIDYDPVCGYTGYIGDGPCPRCGRYEFEDVPLEKHPGAEFYS